jgi:multiple sugar transport system ATP-binding protein
MDRTPTLQFFFREGAMTPEAIEKARPKCDNSLMAAVVISHLGKTFPGGIRAVDDLSLEVADHELLALMGPSGCGKTTTLRLIAGLDQPTAGRIFIDGRAADRLPPRDRDVAMVFQQGALYPHLSVRGNLGFGLKVRRVSRGEIGPRVEMAAAVLGISDLLDRRPHELSYGQQQRVALGRAIVRRPKLFLLDEPLASLDATLRRQLRHEIRGLHQRLGVPMIYVTHDAAEAMALGQRVAILREGRLQQVGDPQVLYDRPGNRFVAALLGSAGMNFLDGRIEKTDGRCRCLLAGNVSVAIPECCRAAIEPYTDKAITLGVRPEHLQLATESDAQHLALGTRQPVAIPATVEAVERQGAESHVFLKTGANTFSAHTRGGVRPTPGDQVVAVAEFEHLYFFDPRSEATINAHCGPD